MYYLKCFLQHLKEWFIPPENILRCGHRKNYMDRKVLLKYGNKRQNRFYNLFVINIFVWSIFFFQKRG